MDPYNSLQLSSKAAMDNSSYEERHQTSFRLFVPCVPAQNLRKDLHKYLSSFGEIVEIIYQKKDRGSAPPTRDDPTIGSGSCINKYARTRAYGGVISCRIGAVLHLHEMTPP